MYNNQPVELELSSSPIYRLQKHQVERVSIVSEQEVSLRDLAVITFAKDIPVQLKRLTSRSSIVTNNNLTKYSI